MCRESALTVLFKKKTSTVLLHAVIQGAGESRKTTWDGLYKPCSYIPCIFCCLHLRNCNNPIDLGHPLMNFWSLRVVCIKTQALYIFARLMLYTQLFIFVFHVYVVVFSTCTVTLCFWPVWLILLTYLLRPSKSYLTPPKRLGLGNGLTQVSHHIHTRLRKLVENVKLAKFY